MILSGLWVDTSSNNRSSQPWKLVYSTNQARHQDTSKCDANAQRLLLLLPFSNKADWVTHQNKYLGQAHLIFTTWAGSKNQKNSELALLSDLWNPVWRFPISSADLFLWHDSLTELPGRTSGWGWSQTIIQLAPKASINPGKEARRNVGLKSQSACQVGSS